MTYMYQLRDNVLAYYFELLCRHKQVRVIGIHDLESCFSCGSEMNRIRRAEIHSRGQLRINPCDARENVRVLRQPLKGPSLNVSAELAQQRSVCGWLDSSFTQLAMKSCNHLHLAMRSAGDVVRCRQCANNIRSGICVIKTNEVAGVEVNHLIPLSRSSLMIRV